MGSSLPERMCAGLAAAGLAVMAATGVLLALNLLFGVTVIAAASRRELLILAGFCAGLTACAVLVGIMLSMQAAASRMASMDKRIESIDQSVALVAQNMDGAVSRLDLFFPGARPRGSR